MALLGFGASGSVVAVAQEKIREDLSRYLFPAALLFPLFLSIGFIVSSQLDFNPYEISFSFRQVGHLFLYFIFMGIGFFWGAVIICLAFIMKKISRVYFANLAGSAAGGAFVLCLSFLLHPHDTMGVIIIISLVPSCLLACQSGVRAKWSAAGGVIFVAAALVLSFSYLNPKQVSQYKPISGALNLPGAIKCQLNT